MDLDISQGPLSDSSKEEEEEEELPPYLNPKVSVSRLNLDYAEGIPSGLSEGLLLSTLVDSITLEGGDSTPRDALRNDLPRIHSDRSISPSVSSSISVVSSTGGRRNLEWDSGADLGYCGPGTSSDNKKTGPELSALEKLAIRNYKEILGPSNDAPKSFYSHKKNKKEYEIEKLRLKKFGDFLLRYNDHIDSTPSVSKLVESPAAALRSYESISPLSPIRSESNRRVHRRSKSWSDIRCSEHEGFLPSKSFKNLRGSSPIEPSSSSSTGTVIPALHPQRSSEFINSRINSSILGSVEIPRRLTNSSDDSSSKGDHTLQNPTEEDNIQRSCSTSEEETKVLNLSVKVIRSPPIPEDAQSDIEVSQRAVSNERNVLSPENSYRALSRRTLFKLYKRKLSHYIQIISTPSLTYGESKMKQKLAGKLMSLMKEDGSHCHHDSDSPNSTSSLKLEREMKKLDKLERKLLKCVPSLSLYKSDASLTTTTESSCSSFKGERVLTSHLSQLSISNASVTSLKSNQDISTSSSSDVAKTHNLRQDSVTCEESRSITSMPTQVLNVPRLHDRNSPEILSKKTSDTTSDNILSLTETESDRCRCKPANGSLSTKTDLARSDFGQTYPSPSDGMSKVQCTETLMSVSKKSEFVQTCPLPRGSSFEKEASSLLTRQEEVYYALQSKENTTYKSVCNVPPEKSIISNSKSDNSFYFFEHNSKQRGKKYIEDFCMSKENRNIISNHVAGLDLNPRRRKPLNKAPKANSSNESISLQDSLVKNHPSFLARSRKRVKLLRESREQRLIEQERKKDWLLSIASLSPESRRKAELSYVPIKAKRIFNHKKMVEETRKRCQNLPEVIRVQRDLKRAESYRTNRIMLDLYNRKVKSQLFKRRIRSAH